MILKKSNSLKSLLILLVLLVLTACAGSGGGSDSGDSSHSPKVNELSGIVKTADGSPAQGVTVTLVDTSGLSAASTEAVYTLETGSNGGYLFTNLSGQSVQLSFAKDGYATAFEKVDLSQSTGKLNPKTLTPMTEKKTVINANQGGEVYTGTLENGKEISLKINPNGLSVSAKSNLGLLASELNKQASTTTIPMSVTKIDLTASPYLFPDGKQVLYIVLVQPWNYTFSGELSFTGKIKTNTDTLGITDLYYLDINTLEWEKVNASLNKEVIAGNKGFFETNTFQVSNQATGYFIAVKQLTADKIVKKISGKITDQLNNPLPYVYVHSNHGHYVQSDSIGNFTLNTVPIGALIVNTFYYDAANNETAEKTVSFNIQAGQSTIPVIQMTFNQLIQLSGSVSDSAGNPITEGTVFAVKKQSQNNEYNSSKSKTYTTSIKNGHYAFNGITAGSYHVQVSALGYTPQTREVTINTNTLTEQFTLSAVPDQLPAIYSDNFENEANSISHIASGWTATGLWHRQLNPEQIQVHATLNRVASIFPDLPADNSTSQDDTPDHLPQAQSGTAVYWFGNKDTGTLLSSDELMQSCSDFGYLESPISEISPTNNCMTGGTSKARIQGTLTSPKLDTRGFGNGVKVSFSSWWEIESVDPATFDTLTVRFSYDGGKTWVYKRLNPKFDPSIQKPEYALASGANVNEPGNWELETIQLDSKYITDQLVVQFEFDSKDTLYNGFRGWLIDSIQIEPGNGTLSDNLVNYTTTIQSQSKRNWK